ncbi:MAG: membrane protein insertion efficiency factor YidD [Halanaerobiales bacterium]|nr:membrane protein insertion efficiency factor YidD [Halanaerobiales bacterium]
MQTILIKLIEFYQRVISPWTPKTCRFYPTCSQYCKMAILKYGVITGAWISLKRVLRCHPFNPGGYDPLE